MTGHCSKTAGNNCPDQLDTMCTEAISGRDELAQPHAAAPLPRSDDLEATQPYAGLNFAASCTYGGLIADHYFNPLTVARPA